MVIISSGCKAVQVAKGERIYGVYFEERLSQSFFEVAAGGK
jgi:hypothetical protein